MRWYWDAQLDIYVNTTTGIVILGEDMPWELRP